MRQPANRSDRFIRFYTLAVRLYPQRFRQAYASPMLQAFRDAINDDPVRQRPLERLILRDLILTLAKEHLAMLLNTFGRPALIFNALVLSALATGLALALNIIPQQVLRQGANDPQIALAGDLVVKLENGAAATEAVPRAEVDMARSLSPFVIVYDDQGHPLASQAQLAGQTPAPPQGVFDFVRKHGEERVSWQPMFGAAHGVRIAAVVQRVASAKGSAAAFVLAGRSMREVEAREAQVGQLATLTWIGMMAVIILGTIAFGWYTRPKAV
jgi:hypothetical protein